VHPGGVKARKRYSGAPSQVRTQAFTAAQLIVLVGCAVIVATQSAGWRAT